MPFDPHLLSFWIRCIHVVSMAFLLGGALYLWAAASGKLPLDEHNRLLLYLSHRYELFFWLAIGVQVITGIGNIGSFGTGLPGPASPWGIKLILKLSAVLIFILLSLPRSIFIDRSSAAGIAAGLCIPAGRLRRLYVFTALFLAGIVVGAEYLTHG